jgi:hypothetical protein
MIAQPDRISPSTWQPIKDADPRAITLFRRHYTYRKRRDQFDMFNQARNRNMNHVAGPGEKLFLVTPDERALFVWRKFISMNHQQGVNCAVFRNEGSCAGRSSDLIQQADYIAWSRWPGERLYTYVDTKKVKSRNPGYCFLMAGWRRCGWTKSGLLIMECLPALGVAA